MSVAAAVSSASHLATLPEGVAFQVESGTRFVQDPPVFDLDAFAARLGRARAAGVLGSGLSVVGSAA
jgi:hypothetical protein